MQILKFPLIKLLAKNFQRLDSNLGTQVSEATTLSTASSQPLSKECKVVSVGGWLAERSNASKLLSSELPSFKCQNWQVVPVKKWNRTEQKLKNFKSAKLSTWCDGVARVVVQLRIPIGPRLSHYGVQSVRISPVAWFDN